MCLVSLLIRAIFKHTVYYGIRTHRKRNVLKNQYLWTNFNACKAMPILPTSTTFEHLHLLFSSVYAFSDYLRKKSNGHRLGAPYNL